MITYWTVTTVDNRSRLDDQNADDWRSKTLPTRTPFYSLNWPHLSTKSTLSFTILRQLQLVRSILDPYYLHEVGQSPLRKASNSAESNNKISPPPVFPLYMTLIISAFRQARERHVSANPRFWFKLVIGWGDSYTRFRYPGRFFNAIIYSSAIGDASSSIHHAL